MRNFFVAGAFLFALYRWQSNVPTTQWVQNQGYSTTGVPSGLVALTVNSGCPTGFSEVSALNGKFLQGTIAANGDVGTTGGNATITPAGQVSQPGLSMNSYTPSGTNAATTTGATSAGTPTGTNSATATSGNCAATNIAAGTGSTTACKATAPNLTVPAETFSGSAMATHTHTVPAETFTGTAAILTGSVSQPTFTGSAIDPRPQFTKVIFCSKN